MFFGKDDRDAVAHFLRAHSAAAALVEELEAPAGYVMKPGDTVFVHERFL